MSDADMSAICRICVKIRSIDVENCYKVSGAEIINHHCLRRISSCVAANPLSSID